jgi:hypothetical protein
MRISKHNFLTWGAMSVILILMTMLCVILAAVMTDTLVVRPTVNGGSITTLLPGWTYATATIMKVCLLAGVVSAVFAVVNYVHLRWLPILRQPSTGQSGERHAQTMNSAVSSGKNIPILAILSVGLTPLTQLIGALTILIAQALVDKPEGISRSYFPLMSRTGVLVMFACLVVGMVLGVVALFKHKSRRSLGGLGVVMNAFLIGLFRYFEFYKLSFDQDRWAGY